MESVASAGGGGPRRVSDVFLGVGDHGAPAAGAERAKTGSPLAVAYDVFLSAFAVLASEPLPVGSSAWMALHVFGLVQLLLLPLSPNANMPWFSQGFASVNIVGSFHRFLLAVTFTPWSAAPGAQILPYAALNLWACFFVIMASMLVLFGWTCLDVLRAHTHRGSGSWRLHVLRFLMLVSVVALPVPLIGNLLSPAVCDPVTLTWGGLTCWSPAHSAITILSLFALIPGAAFMLAAAALFQSRLPDAKNYPMAVAHGRVDAIGLGIKMLLALVFVGGATTLNSWAHVVLNLASACALVGLQVTMLPLFDHALNKFLSLLYGVFATSCVAALLAVAVATSTSSQFAAAVGGVLWAFLLPLGAFIGDTLADSRWRSLASSRDITSVFVLELRIRFLLTEALAFKQQHTTPITPGGEGASSGGGGGGGGDVASEQQQQQQQQQGGSGAYCPVVGDVSGGAGSAPAGHPALQPAQGQTAVRITTVHNTLDYGAFGSGLFSSSAGASPAFLEALRSAEALVELGLSTYVTSGFMRLFAAHAVRALHGNSYLERLHIRSVIELSDPAALDLILFSRLRSQQLQEDEKTASSGKMTVEARLFFDALQAEAKRKVTACRSLILSFWSVLCDRRPDLIKLAATGLAIREATHDVESNFRDLLTLVPTSVPVMRAFAEFLLDVSNHPRLAKELMMDADQLEDEVTKTQKVRHSVEEFVFGLPVSLDFASEGVGLLRVSARKETLGVVASEAAGIGVVTHANLIALQLLGYTNARRELLGREMSAILPSPLAAVHPRYLSGFLASGLQRLTGSSRVLFALHHDGFIVPIKAHVQATGEQWLLAAEEMPAPHVAFLWITGGDSSSYVVTAACQRAFAILGISPPSLRNNNTLMSTFMHDPGATLRRIVSAPGSVVMLRNLAMAATHTKSFLSAQGPGPLPKGSNASAKAALEVSEKARPPTSTGFFTCHVQEVALPLVQNGVFIVKLVVASSMEVKTAAQLGRLYTPPGDLGASLPSPPPTMAKADLSRTSKKSAAGSPSESDDEDNGADDELVDNNDSFANSFVDGGAISGVDSGIGTGEFDAEETSDVSGDGIVHDLTSGGAPPVAVPHLSRRPARSSFRGSLKKLTRLGKQVAAEQKDSELHIELPRRVVFNPATTPASPTAVIPKAIGPATADSNPSKEGAAPAPPPKPPSKAASQSSSQGSAGSQMSPSEAIRRGVAARSQHLEASLVKLRLSLFVVFIVVAATNVASFVTSLVLSNQLIANFASLQANAARSVFAQRAMAQVQKQVLSNAGLFTIAEGYAWSNERERSATDELESYHRTLMFEAYSAGGAELAAYSDEIWPVLDLVPGTYVDNDNYVATPRNVSLANLGLEVVARLREFWWLPHTAKVVTNPDVFFLRTNLKITTTAFNTSLFSASDSSSNVTDSIDFANTIVLAGALAVFFFVTVAVIIPSTREVLREQREVFNVFACLPISVLRHLRGSLADRIQQLNQTEAGADEGGGIVFQDDDEVDEHNAPAHESGIEGDAANGHNRASDPDEEHADTHIAVVDKRDQTRFRGGGAAASDVKPGMKGLEVVLAAASNKHRSGPAAAAAAAEAALAAAEDEKKKARPLRSALMRFCCGAQRPSAALVVNSGFRRLEKNGLYGGMTPRPFARANTGLAWLLLRAIWPVLVFTAYYSGMYVWRNGVASNAALMRSSLLWSVALQVIVPTIGGSVRNFQLFPEPAYVTSQVNAVAENVLLLQSILDGLAYGDSTRGLPSLLVFSPSAAQVLDAEGCVNNALTPAQCVNYGNTSCVYFYEMSACKVPADVIGTPAEASYQVFDFNIVSSGMLSAARQYVRLVLEAIREQHVALAALEPNQYLNVTAQPAATVTGANDNDVLAQLGYKYLPAGLEQLSNGLEGEASALLSQASSLDVLALSLSILSLLGFYAAVYSPLISHLDGEIKKTRFLLLLVPEEVAKNVPAVVAVSARLVQGTQV